MKDIRCLFGRHKFIHSIEEEGFLKEECPRCGKIQVTNIEETLKYLSKNYPEVVAAYREVHDQIDEFKQLKKCMEVNE